jgi:hypothetical protein
VAQESKGFSKKQMEEAKTARDFQAEVGHPSTHNLKSVIKLNLVAKCPVAAEDVDCAEKIYGPSLPILKNKTMHRSPLPVISDYVVVLPSIMSANKYVTLYGDFFFVNKVLFLATISDHITYRRAHRQPQNQTTLR